jgi:hypothetical protein
MAYPLALVVVTVFSALSLIHFYWALGGELGKIAVLPEISGRPAFMPSTASTVFVAVGLALCALLVAATANLVGVPLSGKWLRWLAYALAAALFVRAIGDFRLVGFFKRVRDSRFARLDTLVYSPLCLLLAIGVFQVASSRNI